MTGWSQVITLGTSMLPVMAMMCFGLLTGSFLVEIVLQPSQSDEAGPSSLSTTTPPPAAAAQTSQPQVSWAQQRTSIASANAGAAAAAGRLRLPTCLMELLGVQNALESWCFYTQAEPCKFRDYPLTVKMVDQDGFYHGDATRLMRLLMKIAKKQTIHVMELGGSFSAGEGCEKGSIHGRSCAWTERARQLLAASFPNTSFNWISKARRATTSAGFLTGLGPMLKLLAAQPDLIFLELLINDAKQGMHVSSHINASDDDVRRGAFEALVRGLQQRLPNAQIIVVLGACPECIARRRIHADIAYHYRLPTIDYARMTSKHNKVGNISREAPDWLWPQTIVPAKAPGVKWTGFMPEYLSERKRIMGPGHPPWTVHEKLSQIVGYALLKLLEEQCSQPPAAVGFWPRRSFVSPAVLSGFPTCFSPSTHYSAVEAFSNPAKQAVVPTVNSGNWRLFEDRAGKPGWIATEPGSTLWFPVRLNQQGERYSHVVSISWLASYEGLCDALAYMFPKDEPQQRSNRIRLHTEVSENSSQARSGFFGIGSIDGLQCFNSNDHRKFVSYTDYILEIKIPAASDIGGPGCKFKVLEITAC
eukprot:TRINITY_DN66479_c0_g1_i1.p1 TRINITY_DN66479_c0_g1~~TRINITY_DN66479_c0_g1_i1.p1  ORF type:complete len:588 (+),score=78.69 TRINITY_DN66479_c0_g1_i1:170-1933(+)